MKLVALLDCNNFFVSCERVFRPDLEKKPVVVLSNNDGCVISRSKEIKELGIPMGVPWFKVKSILQESEAVVFSSNFTLYADLSARVMALINSLVPNIEVYSIDEAFLDLSDVLNPLEIASSIRTDILKSLGIPTCIGISRTKTLAKVANHFAKMYPSFRGACLLETDEQIQAALKRVNIEDLWGIGRNLSLRLKTIGIRTAFDLQQVDPRWMRQHYTVIGERIIQELRGISCSRLTVKPLPKKSIQISRSFAKNITSYNELRQNVATYAARLAIKLRKENVKAKTILVYIRTNKHRKDMPFHSESSVVNLPVALDDDGSLIKACVQELKSIYRPGAAYKKAGVGALQLIPSTHHQQDFFSPEEKNIDKIVKISKVMDKLNSRFGQGAIHMASCGARLSWGDRKDNKSPLYTSCWKQLPIVFAK